MEHFQKSVIVIVIEHFQKSVIVMEIFKSR